MLEDLSRVRTPNSALVLGMVRRVVLSLANAAVDLDRKENPKSKFNTKSFRQRYTSACGDHERLQSLIFAKPPPKCWTSRNERTRSYVTRGRKRPENNCIPETRALNCLQLVARMSPPDGDGPLTCDWTPPGSAEADHQDAAASIL